MWGASAARAGSKLKIFVSHGSGKDAEVVEALSVIKPELSERGYDVFVDVERLRVGEAWSPSLYEEMYLCDAAIVLLGPKTIEGSDWVRRESDVLMSRHFVRSLRTVLPCFLGTQDTSLARKRGFGALLTLQAELGQREKRPLPVGQLTQLIINWILDEFAPVAGPPGDGAFHAWTKRIAAFLRVARECDPSSLEDAAIALCCSKYDRMHMRASIGAELFLTHMLFRAGEQVRENGNTELPASIAALRPSLGAGQLSHVVAELLPSWADPDVASNFAPPHPPEEGHAPCLILLRAYGNWAAEQHIARALCNEPGSFSHRSLAAHGDIPLDESSPYEELMDSCVSALQEVFEMPPEMGLLPGMVGPRRRRDYLIINARGHDFEDIAHVVNELHDKYSWLVIIVVCPDALPEEKILEDLNLSHATLLAISAQLERDAFSFKQTLHSVMGMAS
ncbi:toll/interleukin-1 receptor domain-containing protein [Streptomyces gardneri]|uniref:TIR domain-containing protein n=1 Tax=Streptomyces gardneri TaxID=66892 RepID=A0A4Y3RIH2_9ACTN|nr:toll/interleukin-1 receptor domain-containing protein [Streptomyces gardneri]GEB57184.1 hypothetical protein SGA01_27890 [Streptomyces gardneri]GHH22526.1 hypothetical protein GCM10017674_78360 [Streptomyces gardneri]